MKFNKTLLIISMILISLFAIGTVSASDSDNATDIMEISAVDEKIETIDVNQDDILSVDGDNASDVQVNLNVEDATYDERVSINVTVVDNTHTVDFSTSTVEILVDGKYIANAPISSTGQSGCELALGELDVGRYHVQTTLVNGTNKIATNSTVFSVNKATPVVNVENVTVEVYENVAIPVNITDKKGKGISGGAIVTIFWQGDSLSKYVQVVDGNAKAIFDFTDVIGIMSSMSMGDMMSMFGGDGGMDWESMFGGNTTMDDWKNMFGGNGTSGMNWTEMFGGNGTGGMNWAEMFGGNSSGNMMEGMMTVTYEYIFTPGKYNVTTTFLSNRNYDRANATSELLVTYIEDVAYLAEITTPKKLGDKTVADIAVVDKFTNPIPNVTVTVILDGKKTYNVTLNENGTAKLTFDNLVNGNHKLELQSNANGSLTGKIFDFNVDIIKANVTIVADDISISTVNVKADGKIGEYFTATIKDSLGNPVDNKTVYISINNEKYAVTVEDGVAKLQLNIAKAGTYTCSVALLSDDVYNGAFNISNVKVNKQKAKITVAKKTYKTSAKTKKVTATFKSAKGNAIKNKKIAFKVKGKTYTAKTNSKGVATIKVKLAKKGTYKVTAKFAGDNTYKAVSKTGKLILK